MVKGVLEKTVGDLVDENFIYARALHYLGIEFFRHENTQLKTICQLKKIDHTQLIKSLYRLDTKSRLSFSQLSKYPITFTLEYLKLSHQHYIKEHLPYIATLVNNLPLTDGVENDLKEIFPLFVEDFIKHIYHEEDELFGYCKALLQVKKKKANNPLKTLWPYRTINLDTLHAHHAGEDEMEGMRNFIRDLPKSDLLSDVIVREIKAFDRELVYHAEIENQILFPKAKELKKEVDEMCTFHSNFN